MSNKKIKRKDYIKGGLADNKKISDFNTSSLREGSKVEMEHTNNKYIAREIAMDHLSEDKRYYKKLKRIEKQDILDITADGKQEIIQGKEPLKKDPIVSIKTRWNTLKKGLNNLESIMDLKEASQPDEEDKEKAKEQQPQQSDENEQQPDEEDKEKAKEQQPQQSDENEQQPDEEDKEKAKEQQPQQSDENEQQPEQEPDEQERQQPEQFDEKAHEQEIVASLKEEGYTDPEIAYIVYGHHTASHNVSNEAKAEAIRAMSEVNSDHTKKLGDIDREMKMRQLELEHEHAKRMKDLEYQRAQMQSPDPETENNHQKRMLDLQYENAKANSPDNYNKQHNQKILDIDLAQRQLELEKRKQEIALELEFKKKELELKIKHAENMYSKNIQEKSTYESPNKTEDKDGKN